MLGANPYNSAARCGSRPPTAISRPFEEAWIAGETIFTPIFAVLITPQRTISLLELWLFCIVLSAFLRKSPSSILYGSPIGQGSVDCDCSTSGKTGKIERRENPKEE